jgi:hypothetical protein
MKNSFNHFNPNFSREKWLKNDVLHEKFGLSNVFIITNEAALQATV